MSDTPKTMLVVELDRDELAVRIAEKLLGRTRPADKSATEALDSFDAETRAMFRAAAFAAMEYFRDVSSVASRQEALLFRAPTPGRTQ